MKCSITKLGKKSSYYPYLLILPACFILIALTIYPIGYSLVLSFYRWILTEPTLGYKFIGFGNYIRASKDSILWISLRNTLVFTAAAVGIEFVLGLGIALLMNKEFKGVQVIRMIIIVPTTISIVISALIGRYMFFSGYGIISYLLDQIGFSVEKGILAQPRSAFLAILTLEIWQWTPFMTLMLLAGLQSLPKEPYESAKIDGASKLQILLCISLPIMKPIILTALILRTMDVFRMFDLVYVLTKGGPGNSTMLVSVYTFKRGLNFFEIGYAACLSWIMVGVVIVISLFWWRVSR